MSAMVQALQNEFSGKTTAAKVALIETRAREVLSAAIARPCVAVTIGDDVLVTEWLTEGDAELAADFFDRVMRRETRISYDTDLGWVCEAAERF